MRRLVRLSLRKVFDQFEVNAMMRPFTTMAIMLIMRHISFHEPI